MRRGILVAMIAVVVGCSPTQTGSTGRAQSLAVPANVAPPPAAVGCPSAPRPPAFEASIGSGGSPIFTEYPVPAELAGLSSITAGPDGSLWFVGHISGASHHSIVKLTASGTFTAYPVRGADIAIGGITAGPDGNIWFTEWHDVPTAAVAKVARLTPSGTLTEFAVRGVRGEVSEITTGPDCNLWIAAPGANAIIKMTTSGTFVKYSVPSADGHPAWITAGPDGALWFAELKKVGRITTSGQIIEFPLPAPEHTATWGFTPTGLVVGGDGNLWITEYGDWPGGGPGRVAKLTTSGVFFEFDIPSTKPAPGTTLMRDIGPRQLAAGPNQRLWFSNIWNLVSVTASGVFSQYMAPVPEGHFSKVNSITAGPGGAVWFVGSDTVWGTQSGTSRPLVGKLEFR